MTRKELKKIIQGCFDVSYGPDGATEYFSVPEAIDSILAALEKEREGEMVLADGEMGEDMMMEATCNSISDNGKQGQLIFRPSKGDK